MPSESQQVGISVLPVQLVPVPDGVIIKRGRMEFKVTGTDAHAIVLSVLDQATRGVSAAEIACSFTGTDHADIQALIQQLVQHRLVIPADDPSAKVHVQSSLELFYWSAGAAASDTAGRTKKARVTVVGVNEVSRALVDILSTAGFESVEVVNYPFLCNLRLLDGSGELASGAWGESLPKPIDYTAWTVQENEIDCLVATSDFGGLELMRAWNEYCAQRRIPFLPAVLQDLVGYLGPLFVPGETACFECVRARQNSNMDDPHNMRAAERLAFFGQGVTAAFHPALPAVLGNLAALELSRYLGEWGTPRTLGTLVEVDLLEPEIVSRPVLKLPRCRVCGDSAAHSTTELFRGMFLPGTHGPHE